MGGDWFDVIPLPGARVALVVGDVVGHGLHAAATMGRLRTAVHNFSALDLPPDELLGYLDELVARIDEEEEDEEAAGITGATCLYAVYDPASGSCCMATAGHYAPAVVRPDGSVEYPEVPVFPPLGLGGGPFENYETRLPEGSRLVLYTDGLIENRQRDVDTGLRLLGGTLADGGSRSPEETCRALVDAMLPTHRSDDIALLVARTRLLEEDRVADWDVPGTRRRWRRSGRRCGRQLERWGLGDIGFTTELMLSRTDHQRHPVRLRAHPCAHAARPRVDLRGVGRQQHVPAPAQGRDDGRGRTGAVPGVAVRGALGDAVHGERQGDVDGAAAHGRGAAAGARRCSGIWRGWRTRRGDPAAQRGGRWTGAERGGAAPGSLADRSGARAAAGIRAEG